MPKSLNPFSMAIRNGGGPQNQTITTVYWIFNNSFTYYKLGYGAALSIVLLTSRASIQASRSAFRYTTARPILANFGPPP